MRVLHVIPSVAKRDGGPATAIRSITRELARIGVNVSVATTDADGNGRLDVPLRQRVIQDGVDYRYFPLTIPGSWKYSLPLSNWLHENMPRFDVVHVHSVFSAPTLLACRAARARRRPYIVRPLGGLDVWSLQQKAWKKRPYLQLLERPNLTAAAAIHVTSENEADAVGRLGYASRVRLVRLGADLTSRAGSETRDTFNVLFMSRLHEKKGLPFALAALARLKSLPGPRPVLTIAGRGADAYERWLRGECLRLGIEDQVVFAGHLDGSAKARALAAADAFVLPSFTENFGIAVAEAMGASIPVVLTRDVGVATAAERGGAGLVVERDPTAIAAALQSLRLDRDLRTMMGRNARILAESEFSWGRVAAELVSLYDECIAGCVA